MCRHSSWCSCAVNLNLISMKWFFLYLSLLVLLPLGLLGQVIEVSPVVYDFGTIVQGQDGTAKYVVRNTGYNPLMISNCKSLCGCLVANCDTKPIPPGGESVISAKYDTRRVGPINKAITVYSNAQVQVIRVTGKVVTHEQAVRLGLVPQNGPEESEDLIVSVLERPISGESAFVYGDDGEDCSGQPINHHDLEDLVTTNFAGNLRVLERRNLEAILEEQRKGLSGIFDESSIVEAGRLAGAKYVLIPKVGCLLGEQTFNLKVISCTDATTLAAANASAADISLRDFFKEVRKSLFP